MTRHPGGTVVKSEAVRLRTGGWRTEGRPAVELEKCVNCLLCWLYCPDAAVQLEGSTFVGFDYEVCKGCQICVEMCPTGAIAMVPEEEEVDAA